MVKRRGSRRANEEESEEMGKKREEIGSEWKKRRPRQGMRKSS